MLSSLVIIIHGVLTLQALRVTIIQGKQSTARSYGFLAKRSNRRHSSAHIPPPGGVIDRQTYLFECMLRCPSFQQELFNFVREYPVFFRFQKRLLHSYGKVEKPVTVLWDWFLIENAARLKTIEETDEETLYKYVFSENAQQPAELEQWETKAREFEMELWRTATHLKGEFPEGPLLSRLPLYEGGVLELLPGPVNPEYLSMAGCEAEDFERAERLFTDKWHVFPHHVCPQKEPIVLLRDELEGADPNVQLFIPVSDVTTKEALEKRWIEVVHMQQVYYAKKRRPHRTRFESLLRIYDLRREMSPSVVANKMGISRSAVEKQYKRVYRDIHGTAPKRGPKSQWTELHGRRKTRVGFKGIVATYGNKESEDEALRSVFLDQGLPLAKLYAPDTLSPEQKQLLREGLLARNDERPRKRLKPALPSA